MFWGGDYEMVSNSISELRPSSALYANGRKDTSVYKCIQCINFILKETKIYEYTYM
jgi:hypothetical protein